MRILNKMSEIIFWNDFYHFKGMSKILLLIKFNFMSEIHPVENLNHLLDHDSRKFTIAEIQLQNVLPGWIQKANSLKLKSILQKYFELVKMHVSKLETFFEEESYSYLNSNNRIMHILIEEAEEKINNCTNPFLKDACMLSTVQNINHYKISTYGTAAAFANTLGKSKTAVLFHECEVNEKQIDDRLSQLAEFEINKKARNAVEIPRYIK